MAALALRLETLLSPSRLPAFSSTPPLAASTLTATTRPLLLCPRLLFSPIQRRRSQFLVRALSAAPSMTTELKIKSIPTKPVEGQKTGTSGLRKKRERAWQSLSRALLGCRMEDV